MTVLVRFWVLPSLYVPVAVNCWRLPSGIEGLAGVTAMETNTGDGFCVTDVVDPLMAPNSPVIVADPGPTPVALPEGLMVTTDELDDDHVT